MDNLRIPLARIPEEGLEMCVAAPAEELGGEHAQELRTGPVTITGTVTESDQGFVFLGTVSGAFVRACDRCLTEVELPYVADACWTFAEGVSDDPFDSSEELEQEGLYPCDGVAVDLAVPAWEEVVLAYPARFVCDDRPDLCGECDGAQGDRSFGGTDTPETEDQALGNKGFAGLADMFPDLKPGDSEE
ncbi:MAG: DUF177 domain-containing protein [bacterium]|nr:DUF177 domain-containing protein [bacterium]